MSTFKTFFGKKTYDKQIDFGTAMNLLRTFEEKAAKPVKMVVKISVAIYKENNPSFNYAFNWINSHFSPYQYEHNPQL